MNKPLGNGIARLFGVALLFLSCLSGVKSGEHIQQTLGNQDVIDMVKAGFSPALIEDNIRNSPASFDLTTRALIVLKENGVQESTIQLMLSTGRTGPESDATTQTAPQPATTSADRATQELENIASGQPDLVETGVAYFVANAQQTAAALTRALESNRPEIRAAAALASGRSGNASGMPALRNMLGDSDRMARTNAAAALARLGDVSSSLAAEEALSRQLRPLDGYIHFLGHIKRAEAAPRLMEALARDGDPLARAAAAWALGEIGRSGEIKQALKQALENDGDREVRREAALALAKYRDFDAGESLQQACRVDPDTRRDILSALADFPGSVEFLVMVLNIPADQIAADERETARHSLSRLTGEDFGLDGQRWSDWYEANRSRFPAARNEQAVVAQAATRPSAPAPGEVDLQAWSIVADSAVIPTAPLPGSASAGFGGPPPPPTAASFGGGDGWQSAAPAAPLFPASAGEGVAPWSANSQSAPNAPPDSDGTDLWSTIASDVPSASSGIGGDSWMSTVTRTSSDGSTARAPQSPETTAGWAPVGAGSGTASSVPSFIPETTIPDMEGPTGAESAGTGTGTALPGSVPGWARKSEPASATLRTPREATSRGFLSGPPEPAAAASGQEEEPRMYVASPIPATPDGTTETPFTEPQTYPDQMTGSPSPEPQTYVASPIPAGPIGGGEESGDDSSFFMPPPTTHYYPPAGESGEAGAAPSGPPSMPFGDMTTADDTQPAASGFGDAGSSTAESIYSAGPATVGSPTTPEGGADAAGADGEMPSYFESPQSAFAESEPAGIPPQPAASGSSSIFVDPEEGQVVVGESLVSGSQTVAQPATPSTAIPAGESEAHDSGGIDPYGAGSEPTGESISATTTSAPEPEAPADNAGTAATQQQPAATEPEPAAQQPPIPAPSTPPTVAQPSAPPTFSSPEASFFDPSAPLPPVKPEGTVGPKKGKDQPPMLGEGFF